MPFQFLVIDGADREQVFPLPEAGIVVIGSSQRHADICLHDLYVQRTHCEVEVTSDGTLLVRNLRPIEGILVNKVKTEQQELNLGDVLRVGNTQLRLEPASTAGPALTPRSASKAEPQPRSEPEPKPETLTPAPSLPPERLHELAGHLLGHFHLQELLSQDSHNAVFLACDQKTEETVVLKVLSPLFPARPEEWQHFVEVMRKALPLRHDCLVNLRGAGKIGPYVWMAREHVPGECLADILARLASGKSKPKWQSALRMAVQLAGVLDFLHRHHLMHGHLTPHNVLLNSETKHPRLANLMLDQALKGSKLHRAILADRRTHDVAYFSPEQCEEGAFVDDLSDQYALGALVYARMTGRPPFQADTAEETIEEIRSATLVRPRELNPHVPEEVEAVIVRMLARHQEDRYPDPAAVLADLESVSTS